MDLGSDRKNIEKRFHDNYVIHQNEVRKNQSFFYSKETENYEYRYLFNLLECIEGKLLLLYGSGGHFSLLKEFVKRGAYVIAIDISHETVKKLNDQILLLKMEKQCVTLQMDCENLALKSNSVDIVFGRSIIHHLDIEKSINEIYRILKPGGKLTVIEPLATNPVINLYRKMTPGDRTPFEHPLTTMDILSIGKKFFDYKCRYLYALKLVAFLFRMVSKNFDKFLKLFNLLSILDTFFLKLIPFYKLLCWDVIIFCKKK